MEDQPEIQEDDSKDLDHAGQVVLKTFGGPFKNVPACLQRMECEKFFNGGMSVECSVQISKKKWGQRTWFEMLQELRVASRRWNGNHCRSGEDSPEWKQQSHLLFG